jgi:hypothetical protein
MTKYSLSQDFGLNQKNDSFCNDLSKLFVNKMAILNDKSFYRIYIDRSAKFRCKTELEETFQFKMWKGGDAATFVNDAGDIQIHRRKPNSILEEEYVE